MEEACRAEMGSKIVMPKFTETMEEGTVTKWYKREGDQVREGEPIVQIVGEKLTYDVEAPISGRLLKIFRDENSNVPVGEAIAYIGEEGEGPPRVEAEEKAEPLKPRVMRESFEAKAEARVTASPLAKRLARIHGIDLKTVKGTGPRGRILREDILKLVGESKAVKAEERRLREVVPLVGVRRTVAERMTLSSRIPRITLMVEVDASGLYALQRYYESLEDVKVSITHLVVKAVAKALKENPIMNSTLKGDRIEVFEDVNVGVAVATNQGLVVPVVKDAYNKSIGEIAEEVTILADKARRNLLSREDVSGGTFTVTNLGMFGVDAFTPLINPPECAILGVGRVAERPIVDEGRVAVKPTMQLCLSFDHRIVDGTPAAKFLQRIKEILEGGTSLKEER
ncbi:MAG: dihydrolipoamide acetyltransferase family protein [Candidatus Bathyarchaeia archaeon]